MHIVSNLNHWVQFTPSKRNSLVHKQKLNILPWNLLVVFVPPFSLMAVAALLWSRTDLCKWCVMKMFVRLAAPLAHLPIACMRCEEGKSQSSTLPTASASLCWDFQSSFHFCCAYKLCHWSPPVLISQPWCSARENSHHLQWSRKIPGPLPRLSGPGCHDDATGFLQKGRSCCRTVVWTQY